MALTTSKTATGAALIAAILASAGGYQFLKKHPEPTLRTVFVACEKGELSGIACCEDMNKVTDVKQELDQCGQVTPTSHDPFGVRAREEDEWDVRVAREKAAFVK